MTQKTLVLQIPAADQTTLRQRLAQGEFEFRSVPHAVFSVRGAGVVATLYRSGKFVVQGPDPELFLARYTGLEAPAPPERAPRSEGDDGTARIDGPMIGSDEAGKGDYFGPLVVAAVLLDPDTAREVTALGVTDSKQLTDKRALSLGAMLRAKVPHAIRRLDPPDYNRRYPSYPGLNPMLADLHAAAIAAVAKEAPHGGLRVLVDQFAKEQVMEKALQGIDVRLEQAPRAERNPAVAAASVLARQEFLVCLRELSAKCGVDLHKGAGVPVDRVGARLLELEGPEALQRVAKLHFKNTGKIEVRVRRG